MAAITTYRGLPSSLIPYLQAVFSRKPLLAPSGYISTDIQVIADRVKINPWHVRRYCDICGITPAGTLPPAYLHVLAMPLHMRLFTHPRFPAKVLGLVHLRNNIRQHIQLPVDSTIQLSVRFDSLRETDMGQEYDVITTATISDQIAWMEVSTMLARRWVAGKRPVIERGTRDESRLLCERTVDAVANTGRRYALVSGDYNPIHLFDRTAQRYAFKQCVAHGMWSLARCVGLGDSYLPSVPMELDAQFKLPVYLPSNFLFRAQRSNSGIELALTTTKGDRLHLSVQAKPLGTLAA